MKKKPLTLSQRFSKLLKQIVNTRAYLVETGLSQRPESFMRGLVDDFRPYISYRWKDEGAAKFILKHYASIREMIPPGHKAIFEELESLWMAAKTYSINSSTHQPWNQFASSPTA